MNKAPFCPSFTSLTSLFNLSAPLLSDKNKGESISDDYLKITPLKPNVPSKSVMYTRNVY